MKYNIEKRNGDYFIITDQKYKDNTIVINLSSVIKVESICIQETLVISNLATWSLLYDEIHEKLFMCLDIENFEGINNYLEEIDIITFINECVSCVQNNIMLDKCEYINLLINKTYNAAFYDCIKNHSCILHSSDNIINGFVEIIYNNKVLGYASRFILKKNAITILEYTGKDLIKLVSLYDLQLKFRIKNKDISIDLDLACNIISEDDSVNVLENILGYYELKKVLITDFSCKKNEDDMPEIYPLNVMINPINNMAMHTYVINNNDMDDITKYKISIKPKVKLLDINKIIVEEYCR